MKTMRGILALMLACAGLAVAAVAGENGRPEAKPKWTGSIRVQGKHGQRRLQRMAKISPEEATQAALAAVAGTPGEKKVEETELEVEHGFLVYSVEIRVQGQKGELEVLVDAGNGKVLAQEVEDDEDDEDDDD